MRADLAIILIFAVIFMTFAGLLSLTRLFAPEQLLFMLLIGLLGAFIGKSFCKAIGPNRKRKGGS